MSAGLLSAAMAETALITYRDFKALPGLPLPSDYVAVAIVFGGLGLLPDSANGLKTFAGWGFVVATLLNFWTPGGQVKKPTTQGAAA